MNQILVSDWRDAWKWFSMWGSGVLIAWSQIPPAQQDAILRLFHLDSSSLTAIIGLAIMLGRVVRQGDTPI